MLQQLPDNFCIVSGAQTGVDRAALDAAMAQGCAVGGWCPEGRLAEDGVISHRYPVRELTGAGYRKRTEQNVIDSDATLVIFFGATSGGTALTVKYCGKWQKPHLLIDAQALEVSDAICQLSEFIADNGICVLNVAGPRASGDSRGYAYTHDVISGLLASLAAH